MVAADQVRTSAEGVAVKRPGDLTFALLNEFLDDIVTVTERDINEMILLMLEKHKLVVEAAALCLWLRSSTSTCARASSLRRRSACGGADHVWR